MIELLLHFALIHHRLEPPLRAAAVLRDVVASAPAPELAGSLVSGYLACGSHLTGLADDAGGVRHYLVEVEDQTRRLEIQLQGGQGDADLYVRFGEAPGFTDFDHRPFVAGNDETLWIDNPSPGPWHLLVHAHRAYEGVSLSIRCHLCEENDQPAAELEASDLELLLYFELSGLDTDPESMSPELRNYLLREEGRRAFIQGDYERAVRLWTQWSELDPDNPEPVSLIGDTYLRREQTRRAVELYQRSLHIQPGQTTLAVRVARLLDEQLDDPVEARALLNRYSRIFPSHPEIALAQAEWLLRRNRFDEAVTLTNRVILHDPENIQARTLIHHLLRSRTERFENFLALRSLGETPGMEWILAGAIQQHQLLSRPESWVLMDLVDRLQFEAPTRPLRQQFAAFLPRAEPATENFRLGRMSASWVSSQEQQWDEDGNMVLSADPRQTEAYLRLNRSEAMHNGYIEATVEAARGFFWLYARRGQGNMIRFGFDESGMLYQQIWINGKLHANQTRLWSRPETASTLRLEIRGEGVFTTLDGRPAFGSPLTIPTDMGLGWWGLAPWSPDFGEAAVVIRQVSGGPAPVLFGFVRPSSTLALEPLKAHMPTLSHLAPSWYRVDWTGRPVLLPRAAQSELRLLARFYRVRLMPVLEYPTIGPIPWAALQSVAERDRLDGFTLSLNRMPDTESMLHLERKALETGLDLVLTVREPGGEHYLIREVKSGVSLLPGPRRTHRVPVLDSENDPASLSELHPNGAGILFL